jgi:predicted solute-binding protein
VLREGDGAAQVVQHEIGHAITGNQEIKHAVFDLWRTTVKLPDGPNRIAREVSRYATKNFQEWFAESWTTVQHAREEHWTPLIKAFAERVRSVGVEPVAGAF